MLKTSLALCAIVVYSGCPGGAPKPGEKGTTTADSPIIVSDGSPTTHLKHKGPARDFHVVDSGNGNTITVTVSDGYTVKSLECIGFSSCSAAIPLSAGWSMVAFDGQSGSGNQILTIGSTDNQTVTAVINYPDVDTKSDGGTGGTGGTDIIQPDHQFESATLTNAGVATTFTCPNTPCKLTIHYN